MILAALAAAAPAHAGWLLAQRARPAKGAIDTLYRAAELVPQDAGMRFLAARQLILDGDAAAARRLLRALAADPHDGAGDPAVRLLAVLDTARRGRR